MLSLVFYYHQSIVVSDNFKVNNHVSAWLAVGIAEVVPSLATVGFIFAGFDHQCELIAITRLLSAIVPFRAVLVATAEAGLAAVAAVARLLFKEVAADHGATQGHIIFLTIRHWRPTWNDFISRSLHIL